MTPLALTKTYDPADLPGLAPELELVNRFWVEGAQHEGRKWEYALALRALQAWRDATGRFPVTALDVGGAGSCFRQILLCRARDVLVVDPKENVGIEAYDGPPADAIFCLSVIEHVEHPVCLLRDCLAHLLPNGLLFVTADYWDCEGPDRAHFHWDRKRIYNRDTWEDLLISLYHLRCRRLGKTDWTYHGDHVYNYTFVSAALTYQGSAPCLTAASATSR